MKGGARWFLAPRRYGERVLRYLPEFDVSETEGYIVVKADLPAIEMMEPDIGMTG